MLVLEPNSRPFDRFFVAIPPEKRAAWGKQMAKLVKPGGYLICLVYPMDPPLDYGPPYYVTTSGQTTCWKYWERVGKKSSTEYQRIPLKPTRGERAFWF